MRSFPEDTEALKTCVCIYIYIYTCIYIRPSRMQTLQWCTVYINIMDFTSNHQIGTKNCNNPPTRKTHGWNQKEHTGSTQLRTVHDACLLFDGSVKSSLRSTKDDAKQLNLFNNQGKLAFLESMPFLALPNQKKHRCWLETASLFRKKAEQANQTKSEG